jgi:hypothetical protein
MNLLSDNAKKNNCWRELLTKKLWASYARWFNVVVIVLNYVMLKRRKQLQQAVFIQTLHLHLSLVSVSSTIILQFVPQVIYYFLFHPRQIPGRRNIHRLSINSRLSADEHDGSDSDVGSPMPGPLVTSMFTESQVWPG